MNLRLPLLALVLLGCQAEDQPAAQPPPEPGSPEWKIQNAMSAAPDTVAMHATIMDWATDEAAQPTVLRQGTNGWRCMPSMPGVPHDNPQCLDKQALVWTQALQVGVTPDLTAFGFAYMLAGGATASDTDPRATEPPAGASWQPEPPHFMVFFPPEMLPLFDLPSDPSAGGPWLKWGGTPYVHVVVPIYDIPQPTADSGTREWQLQNATSAAPAAVGQGATIVGWTSGANPSGTTFRRGDSDWTCVADSPFTPFNDPFCFDRLSLSWFRTRQTLTTPSLTGAGLGYMVQGGAGISYEEANLPAERRDYDYEPPHVMLFLPLESLHAVSLPTDPTSGGPWLMWAGTDHAHVMIPVQ